LPAPQYSISDGVGQIAFLGHILHFVEPALAYVPGVVHSIGFTVPDFSQMKPTGQV